MTPSQEAKTLVPADGVALVTGASRGIGRAVALRFASAGRPVGLLARSTGDLDEVAARITQRGGKATAVTCDVADPDQIIAAVQRVRETLGPVRVLVNNAGVFLDRPMPEITLADWRRLLQVNLTSAFVATQAVWPDMVATGGGIIVNVASKAGLQGYRGQSAYCASKAGMLGWARALALEGRAHHVRVHNVCPGGVDTELIAGTPLADRLAGQVMLEASDVAEVVQFCVSQPANVDLPDLLMNRFET